MKATGALSDLLFEFEHAVTESIGAELRRINRPVQINELPCVPFKPDVSKYVQKIRLDHFGQPVIDTSFDAGDEQFLTAFISDEMIGHRRMITLFEMLQAIKA